MPNSRRRKFSIQSDMSRRNAPKGVSSGASSNSTSNSSSKTNKTVPKNFPKSSKPTDSMSIVYETDELSSVSLVKKTDNWAAKSSPNRIPGSSHSPSSVTTVSDSIETRSQSTPQLTPHSSKRETMTTERDRREKPHPHRARIRSPNKKHLLLAELPRLKINEESVATNVDFGTESPCTETVGTTAIDWTQETLVFTSHELDLETIEYEPSEQSLDDMCRICHSGDGSSAELGRLVSACACRGTVGRVHVRCLERWLTESGKSRCELCGTRYVTRRVHRYGVPKALVMWFLSQNAQQLMVDGLGIMLMSPLAVLAAWLSGRTLAGLMTQESQLTPWPLASTFVLACMTLVCYYCWIVSAATRHALGWWIWYRSQYEVRLQLEDED